VWLRLGVSSVGAAIDEMEVLSSFSHQPVVLARFPSDLKSLHSIQDELVLDDGLEAGAGGEDDGTHG